MWLAAKNRMLTNDVLMKRGWHGPSICTFCYKNGESLAHILFTCSYVTTVWAHLLQAFPTTQKSMTTLPGDLPARWIKARLTVRGQEKGFFDICFAATCWELWKERNTRIFDDWQTWPDESARRVHNLVNLWMSALGAWWAGAWNYRKPTLPFFYFLLLLQSGLVW